MIPQHKVDEVRRLLAAGVSQRKTAKSVGVSRGTVVAIAQGRRRDAFESATDDGCQQASAASRCPGCGGMVYLPCRLCHVRGLTSLQRRLRQRRRRVRRVLEDRGPLMRSYCPAAER